MQRNVGLRSSHERLGVLRIPLDRDVREMPRFCPSAALSRFDARQDILLELEMAGGSVVGRESVGRVLLDRSLVVIQRSRQIAHPKRGVALGT